MSYSFKASPFTNDCHSENFDFSVTAKTFNNRMKVLLFVYVLLLIVAHFTFSSSCLSLSTPTTFGTYGSIEEMIKSSWQPSGNDQKEKGFDLRFMKSGVDNEAENPMINDVDELQNSRKDAIHKFIDENGIKAKDYFEDMHLKAEVDAWWAERDVVSELQNFRKDAIYKFVDENGIKAKDYFEDMHLKAEVDAWWAERDVVSELQNFRKDAIYKFVDENGIKAKDYFEDMHLKAEVDAWWAERDVVSELQNFRKDAIYKFVDENGIKAKDYFEDMHLKAGVNAWWAERDVVSVWEYFSASELHSFSQEPYLTSILTQASETQEAKLETYIANPYVEQHSHKAKEEHIEPSFAAHNFEPMKPSFAAHDSEHLEQILLTLIASKLPAEDLASPGGAVAQYLSSKGVVDLLITILVLALIYIFCKHYKKVHGDFGKVQPYSSPNGMKNLYCAMPQREGTQPFLTRMKILGQEDVLNAMRHGEGTHVQSYSSPRGIKNLPTLIPNSGKNHLATHKVQQLSEYKGFGRSTVLLKRKRKNEGLLLSSGENHLATHKLQQLSEYMGSERSTKLLKRMRKNEDLILDGGENRLATHNVQQLSEDRGFGKSTILLKRKQINEDLWERRLKTRR